MDIPEYYPSSRRVKAALRQMREHVTVISMFVGGGSPVQTTHPVWCLPRKVAGDKQRDEGLKEEEARPPASARRKGKEPSTAGTRIEAVKGKAQRTGRVSKAVRRKERRLKKPHRVSDDSWRDFLIFIRAAMDLNQNEVAVREGKNWNVRPKTDFLRYLKECRGTVANLVCPAEVPVNPRTGKAPKSLTGEWQRRNGEGFIHFSLGGKWITVCVNGDIWGLNGESRKDFMPPPVKEVPAKAGPSTQGTGSQKEADESKKKKKATKKGTRATHSLAGGESHPVPTKSEASRDVWLSTMESNYMDELERQASGETSNPGPTTAPEGDGWCCSWRPLGMRGPRYRGDTLSWHPRGTHTPRRGVR